MSDALVSRDSAIERFFRSSQRATIGIASVIAGLIVWETVVRWGFVRPLFLSSPTAIAEAFLQLARSGELERHALISFREFAVGLILAVIAGLPIAILAGWSTRLGWFLQPLVAAIYAAPTVALFPLIIIFVGIGFWDKVLLVFISGFLIVALQIVWYRLIGVLLQSNGYSFSLVLSVLM
jgi:NitT/TauT family transport system permease protein